MKPLLFVLLLCCSFFVNAQRWVIHEVTPKLATVNDTLKMIYAQQLSAAWSLLKTDSAIAYSQMYLELAKRLNYPLNQADALQEIARNIVGKRSVEALKNLYLAEKICNESKNSAVLPSMYMRELKVPDSMRDYDHYKLLTLLKVWNAYTYVHWSKANEVKSNLYIDKIVNTLQSCWVPSFQIAAISYRARMLKDHDSGISLLKRAEKIALQTKDYQALPFVYSSLAQKYKWKVQPVDELRYLRLSYSLNKKLGDEKEEGWNCRNFAVHFNRQKQYDSVFSYAYRALAIAENDDDKELVQYTSKILAETYKALDRKDSALKYMELMVTVMDEMDDVVETAYFNSADYSEELRRTEAEKENAAYHARVRYYSMATGLAVILSFAIFFWRNSITRKKQLLALERQEAKTERALRDLTAAQAQLVQSEKMASLGELTAGIAHEIQNPLNFVNNFSELNAEMITELKEAIDSNNLEEIKSIAGIIESNATKITYHGKRADAIVKGMLQHSRNSSGAAEPVNMNTLVEEYMRLSYHGLRARNATFNATLVSHLNPLLPTVPGVPQDLGRVLLNLFNNAFYAVEQKKASSGAGYEPTVTVTTSHQNGKVRISVADNGTGIPAGIIDKIFQPFFTTKPTGDGTGLGLSLSYDIVKAHGGILHVSSSAGEGTEFWFELNI